MAIAKPGDAAAKANSAGRPVWCVDLRIVDDAGKPVQVGAVGEIICQSPLAPHGYYKNPDATTASFRDGWFYTGDLGYFIRKAIYLFRGASKDMVKSGGISIYPLEIESVIYSHPDILEAAVIGVPDPQWGEALKAVIVLKPGADLDSAELLSFCKARLSAYKVPKSVDFVESLPHTEVGKVHKIQVREMILRRNSGWLEGS